MTRNQKIYLGMVALMALPLSAVETRLDLTPKVSAVQQIEGFQSLLTSVAKLYSNFNDVSLVGETSGYTSGGLGLLEDTLNEVSTRTAGLAASSNQKLFGTSRTTFGGSSLRSLGGHRPEGSEAPIIFGEEDLTRPHARPIEGPAIRTHSDK